MKKTYVVVEGATDAAVLRPLIEAAQLKDVEIRIGGGKSAAMSLGKSIALSRAEPVAVLVDADSRDPQRIAEQRRTFSDLQGPAGSYTRLFLAVPTLEEDLFPDFETFIRIYPLVSTGRLRERFADDRKGVIQTYLKRQADGSLALVPQAKMDAEAARQGFGRPILRELFTYIVEKSGP